ncbi:hypothetical protein D9611_014420 [Ephemerocybe angulata]|uniref:Cystathionine gamma-synthase n=2 Tax=Ephemerocybe angulata TaxID=980116 RepID=A0A8H6IE64_9AGAR|nr:hypothetical protein D9611_014420 [Tulosesus angulatus]KAF6762712.1 cystathionine gamma-synthase [Tulosesus angulatus]
MSPTPKLSGTDLIHGDTSVVGASRREVAPSISVTTTFRAPKPEDQAIHADLLDLSNPTRHVYSRYTQDVSTRVEHILGKINHGYALTYSSGLSAAYAALVYFQPKRLAIRGGYHGCHATIDVYKKTRGENITLVDLDDEFQPGDLCWLETPVNPTGESRDIRYYADKVHKAGGKIIIDSTFGPPPLQYPFKFGADCVLHSGTKYFGGHSDLLAGVLVVKDKKDWDTLHTDRTYLGSMMGSLESWLLLRSLKTLHLRVPQQSQSGTEIAQWLHQISITPAGSEYDGAPGGLISQVWHSSLQQVDERGFHPKTQMEGGYNATFSFKMKTPEYAAQLPHLLNYFVPATSLGGVESLIERRLDSDPGEDPALIRVSIGVEDLEDLKSDLRQGLRKLVKLPAKL